MFDAESPNFKNQAVKVDLVLHTRFGRYIITKEASEAIENAIRYVQETMNILVKVVKTEEKDIYLELNTGRKAHDISNGEIDLHILPEFFKLFNAVILATHKGEEINGSEDGFFDYYKTRERTIKRAESVFDFA